MLTDARRTSPQVEHRSTSQPRIRRSRRRLTEEQEIRIQAALRTRPPDGHALWTKARAHALISDVTGVAMPDRTFGSYLERWGFAPAKLLRRSYHQDPMVMKAWMVKDYPVIAMLARNNGAEIRWLGRETMAAIRSSTGTQTRVDGVPIGDNFLHASNNRGHIEWAVDTHEPDAARIRGFLDELLEHHQAIELIVPEGLIVRDALFDAWMRTREGRLTIHSLPALRRPPAMPY